MQLRVAFLCLGLVAILADSNLAQAAYFQGLGHLPGGYNLEQDGLVDFAISADGSTVVGQGWGVSGWEAFRWTSSGGMVSLDDSPAAHISYATDVSADGAVIVGRMSTPGGDNPMAFRWISGDGMVALSDFTGWNFDGREITISDDGSTIAGSRWPSSSKEAFVWTSDGGLVGLGDLPGGYNSSQPHAISADGSVVVGHSSGASGFEAFRWTSGGGMVGLGDLPGGSFSSSAFDVSADGSIVVGGGTSASDNEAFRWTETTGMVGLGFLPGQSKSGATAVSADGAVVVGSSGGAFLWDETNGMQNLRDYLVDLGLDLTGWTLDGATDISADGSTIVGHGTNPSGYTEGWIANISTVPEPSTALLLGAGLLGLAARRRKIA